MSSGMYPGLGFQLYLASSDPREPVWLSPRTPDPVIPDGEKSLGIAVNAGMTTSINAIFDAAPTGTAFNVLFDVDPTFANEYVLQAIAAVALQTLYSFSTNGLIPLTGFIRLGNEGGEDLNECYLQQLAVTVG